MVFYLADIFNFQGEDELCECEACQVTEEYLEIAKDSESLDELRSVLRSLYEDAYNSGYDDMLQDDIEVKQELLEKRFHEELDY